MVGERDLRWKEHKVSGEDSTGYWILLLKEGNGFANTAGILDSHLRSSRSQFMDGGRRRKIGDRLLIVRSSGYG